MKRLGPVLVLWVCGLTLLLAGCRAENLSTLKEISKPYVGVYACEEITLGGRDLKEKVEELTLELKGDGTFELSYRTAAGSEGGFAGNYTLDQERGEISLSSAQGRSGPHVFRYEKGAVLIDHNLYGELLHAKFSMP